MRSVRWPLLLAVTLLGIVSLELVAVRPAADAAVDARPGQLFVALTAVSAAIRQPDDWATAILARPLFSATRHPSPHTSTYAEAPIPRLAGVIVSQSRRLAIFATGSADKPVVISEGGRVGNFILQAIAPDQVTVIGPDGLRLLRPSFDPTRPVAPEIKTPTATVAEVALPIEGSKQTLLDIVQEGPQSDRGPLR